MMNLNIRHTTNRREARYFHQGFAVRKVFFFLKKKKQKDFIQKKESQYMHTKHQVMKVFWFFFSKKNAFLPLP